MRSAAVVLVLSVAPAIASVALVVSCGHASGPSFDLATPDGGEAGSDADAGAAEAAVDAPPDAPAPLCCFFDDSVSGGTAATHCASGVATCHDDAGTCSTPLSATGQGHTSPCPDSCDGSVLVCT